MQNRRNARSSLGELSDEETPIIERIVSGGQTGVDRAALDAAMELGLSCGGWCPRGRLAEDGPIDEAYPLRETPSARYAERTEWNVRDSDGTLILTTGRLSGGTALTKAMADRMGKPCLVVDLRRARNTRSGRATSRAECEGGSIEEVRGRHTAGNSSFDRVVEWLQKNTITVLNVAGPRESQRPGIHNQAVAFLRKLLQPEQDTRDEGRRNR